MGAENNPADVARQQREDDTGMNHASETSDQENDAKGDEVDVNRPADVNHAANHAADVNHALQTESSQVSMRLLVNYATTRRKLSHLRRARFIDQHVGVSCVGVIDSTVPKLYSIAPDSSEIITSELVQGSNGEELRESGERWSLAAIKRWVAVESERVRQTELKCDDCVQLLESPTTTETTVDSLALQFDTSRAAITRANGMTGRQILTDTVLIPVTDLQLSEEEAQGSLPVTIDEGADSRSGLISRFALEMDCDYNTADFYLGFEEDYDRAVGQYHADKEWGERHNQAEIEKQFPPWVVELCKSDKAPGKNKGEDCVCVVS